MFCLQLIEKKNLIKKIEYDKTTKEMEGLMGIWEKEQFINKDKGRKFMIFFKFHLLLFFFESKSKNI